MLTDLPITDWNQYMRSSNPRVNVTLDIVRKEVEKRAETCLDALRLYIDGPTGIGKTVLARMIGHKLPGAVIVEIDGSQLTQGHLDFLAGNGICWRVLIVNEAQNITNGKADKIMSGLDAMGKRACVIFTTMRKGSKQSPLFAAFDVDRAITDRCLEVNLTTQGIKNPANVAHVLGLARQHGLDYGADERRIENLFEAEQNSIRGVLAAISRGALAA